MSSNNTDTRILSEQYSSIYEEENPSFPDGLQGVKETAMDIIDAVNLYDNADDMEVDPIYGTPEGYKIMLIDKIGRKIRKLYDNFRVE